MSSSEERWNGIFFQDQHVGYSVAKSTTGSDGTMLLEQRSLFHVATFGQLQQIVTAGTALTTPQGQLQKFDFFFASIWQKSLQEEKYKAIGSSWKLIKMENVINSNSPISGSFHLGMTVEAIIKQQELFVGKTITVPYFDPVTLNQSQMNIKVTSIEILENGEELGGLHLHMAISKHAFWCLRQEIFFVKKEHWVYLWFE